MTLLAARELCVGIHGVPILRDVGFEMREGEVFGLSVPGTLTIKDVSQDIVVDLEAGRGGESVIVVGSWPIEFGDFGVSMPSAPVVVSVEDNGLLEWQIYFTHEGDMSADDTADADMTEEGESSEE